MLALFLLCDCVVAAGVAWLLNWLALWPFRRRSRAHWTERARVLWPARTGAAGMVWVLPADIVLGQRLLWPGAVAPWPLAAVAGLLGVVGASFFFDRVVFPRFTLQSWFHAVLAAWTIRFATWSVFLGIAFSMPRQFDWTVWALCGVFFGMLAVWTRGGLIWALRKLRVIVSAPQRLIALVESVSAQTKVPFRGVWALRGWASSAYALPYTGDLLFSDRLLNLLSDEETAAICAHELGHLGESRIMMAGRLSGWLFYLPLLLLKPLAFTWGAAGVAFGVLAALMIRKGSHRLSQRLERRADAVAASGEAASEIYARALARLHEDNLIPAVMPRQRTHPDLYDRMLAAGVQPDYPRPAKPSSTGPFAFALAILLGVLVVLNFQQSFDGPITRPVQSRARAVPPR